MIPPSLRLLRPEGTADSRESLAEDARLTKLTGRLSGITASAESLVYVASLLVISYLPRRLAFRLAGQVGHLRYAWQRARRRPTVGLGATSLELRLRGTPAQTEAWLRRAFALKACEDLEYWLYPRLWWDDVSHYVRFAGWEHLTAALEQGKGAIIYTGHLKSLFTLPVALGLRGHRVTLLKRQRNAGRTDPIDAWFHERRVTMLEQLGSQLVFTHPPNPFAATRCLAALRRNEIVLALIDVRARRPDDVVVDFLDQSTAFPTGSALLAKTSGAPLIGAWIHRRDDDLSLAVTLSPPIYVTGDPEPVVREQAAYLEQGIRRDPAIWFRWITG